jgi:hypothetical protein
MNQELKYLKDEMHSYRPVSIDYEKIRRLYMLVSNAQPKLIILSATPLENPAEITDILLHLTKNRG